MKAPWQKKCLGGHPHHASLLFENSRPRPAWTWSLDLDLDLAHCKVAASQYFGLVDTCTVHDCMVAWLHGCIRLIDLLCCCLHPHIISTSVGLTHTSKYSVKSFLYTPTCPSISLALCLLHSLPFFFLHFMNEDRPYFFLGCLFLRYGTYSENTPFVIGWQG